MSCVNTAVDQTLLDSLRPLTLACLTVGFDALKKDSIVFCAVRFILSLQIIDYLLPKQT